eukprot:scaffold92967_cov36-Phaeocystis_antarctica.AAC.2
MLHLREQGQQVLRLRVLPALRQQAGAEPRALRPAGEPRRKEGVQRAHRHARLRLVLVLLLVLLRAAAAAAAPGGGGRCRAGGGGGGDGGGCGLQLEPHSVAEVARHAPARQQRQELGEAVAREGRGRAQLASPQQLAWSG